MSTLLLLTSTTQPSAEVLPALTLLPLQVKILPAVGAALLEAPEVDLVLVDGRKELAHARDLCRLIRTTGTDAPVQVTVSVTSPGWQVLPGLDAVTKDDDSLDPPETVGVALLGWGWPAGTAFNVYGDPCQWATTTPEATAESEGTETEAATEEAPTQ